MTRNVSWGGLLAEPGEEGAVFRLLSVGLNLAADTVVQRYVLVLLTIISFSGACFVNRRNRITQLFCCVKDRVWRGEVSGQPQLPKKV